MTETILQLLDEKAKDEKDQQLYKYFRDTQMMQKSKKRLVEGQLPGNVDTLAELTDIAVQKT